MTPAERQKAYRERAKAAKSASPAFEKISAGLSDAIEYAERIVEVEKPADLSWLAVAVDEMFAARQINMMGRRRLLDEIARRS